MTVAGVLAASAGGGYLVGAAGSPQQASAQPRLAASQPSSNSMMSAGGGSMMPAGRGSMMGAGGGSMMSATTRAQCVKVMRDPAMRREMGKLPPMAAIMREQTKA